MISQQHATSGQNKGWRAVPRFPASLVGIFISMTVAAQDASRSELFDLRSKCAEIAVQKQQSVSGVDDVTSHYDIRTNRCFVLLRKHGDRMLELIDGQSGSTYAWLAKGTSFEGNRVVETWNTARGQVKGRDTPVSEIVRYMKSLMGDDLPDLPQVGATQ